MKKFNLAPWVVYGIVMVVVTFFGLDRMYASFFDVDGLMLVEWTARDSSGWWYVVLCQILPSCLPFVGAAEMGDGPNFFGVILPILATIPAALISILACLIITFVYALINISFLQAVVLALLIGVVSVPTSAVLIIFTD